ncbi:MAG: hypothetical protein R2883_07745 [Caldisericia bacterium]
MRKLQVLLLVVVFVFVQFINISAGQNEKVTVHLPVAPSKIIPLTFGVDVMPFDESMDRPYIDNDWLYPFKYVLDEKLKLRGPMNIDSQEYIELTGIDRLSNMDTDAPETHFKNSIYGSRFIKRISGIDGESCVQIFDPKKGVLIWQSRCIDEEEYRFDDLIFEKFVVYKKGVLDDNGRSGYYKYKVFDFQTNEIFFTGSKKDSICYFQVGFAITCEKIFDFKNSRIIDLPPEVAEVLNVDTFLFRLNMKDDLLLIDKYLSGSQRMLFMLNLSGELLWSKELEVDEWINQTIDFNSDYVLYQSKKLMEDSTEYSNFCYRVFGLNPYVEVFKINDYDGQDIIQNGNTQIIGDVLFVKYRGHLDIFNLISGERIKRILVNSETELLEFDGKYYMVDYSHELNRRRILGQFAFAVNDDLTLDYNDFINTRTLIFEDRYTLSNRDVSIKEEDDFVILSIKNEYSAPVNLTFVIPKEDFFEKGYCHREKNYFYSFHENGILRRVDARTGDLEEFSYPKIDTKKYRSVSWDSDDGINQFFSCDEFVGFVIPAKDIETKDKFDFFVSINIESGESKTRKLDGNSGSCFVLDSAVVYSDSKGKTFTLEKDGGENMVFEGRVKQTSRDNVLYQPSGKTNENQYYQYLNLVSVDSFEIKENILHGEKFPEIEKFMFKIDSDADRIDYYNFAESVQSIEKPFACYNDKIVHYTRYGYNFIESEPCPTFSIKKISQDDKWITFEICNTRDDEFSASLSGYAKISLWGHKQRGKEIVPDCPIYSSFESDQVYFNDLKSGSKTFLKLKIPSRNSLVLESDFDFMLGDRIDREEPEYLCLSFYSNGMLDNMESEIYSEYPVYYRFTGCIDYNLGRMMPIFSRTFWPIVN